VADAHDGMLNLLWEQLDPRAELVRGYENREHGMLAGVDSSCDAVFFVGYHARSADGRGILSHTFTGPDTFVGLRLNGQHASKARFNTAVAGQCGVPVALVTGDDVICEETRSWLPHVQTAIVKYAIDRFTRAAYRKRPRTSESAPPPVRPCGAFQRCDRISWSKRWNWKWFWQTLPWPRRLPAFWV
jgi:D-amino peptidase